MERLSKPSPLLAVLGLLLAAVCSISAQAQAPIGTNLTTPVTLEAKTVRLSNFTSIQVCVPMNVAIVPSRPGGRFGDYALAIEAESVVLDSVAATVANSTLRIETVQGFNTSLPIKLVVYLPPTKLSAVAVGASSGEVNVASGFVVPKLSLFSAFTISTISVVNVTTAQLSIGSSGAGQIYVNGTVRNATVVAGGGSSIYVAEVSRGIRVNLGGAAQVFAGVASAATEITGVTTGVNAVTSNGGTCLVKSSFTFGTPCVTITPLVFPILNPLWTCGINVTGTFTCPAGGLQTAAHDSSVGTTLGANIPQFLSSNVTPAAAVAAAVGAAPGAAATPTPTTTPRPSPTPLATVIPGTAGSFLAEGPGGSTVTNVGGDQPGGRTAVAEGSGSQTATAITGTPNSGRKLKQIADFSDLYALLGSAGQTINSATNTPGTFTSTSGPGSLACSFVNGQGGCQSNGVPVSAESAGTSAQTTGNAGTLNAGALNLPPLPTVTPGGTSFTSSSSSSNAGNGQSTQNTVTSGQGSTATSCTTVNGVQKCQQSSNGGPSVSIPGITFQATSPLAAARALAPLAQVAFSSGGATLSSAVCTLPTGFNLTIFD